MKIVVAGSSGLIGRALVRALRADDHVVIRLVRRPAESPDEVTWNPAQRELDLASCGEVDAIVNLAGENIAAGRWTAARREKILRSRVDATQTLVAACVRLKRLGASTLQISDMVGMSEDTVKRYCRFAVQKDNAMAAVHFLDGTNRERTNATKKVVSWDD